MSEHSHIEAVSSRVYRQARGLGDDARRGRGPADAALPPNAAEQPRIAGRYRLGARIGRGRLGEVYEAVDEASLARGVERRVALQLLDERAAADERYVEELIRGFAALQASPHPDIVAILDFGRDGKLVYLVMELLEGVSLRFVLDDATSLPMDEALPVVRAVGAALRYLHAKGIVHALLKPANVFITFEYAVKLLDVVPASRPPSAPGRSADPETRAAADPRDDIYDLACLTYEMLAGRHPFNASPPLEAARAGLTPQPIAGLAAGRWQALAGALALERPQRTGTVTEFLAAFGVAGTERLRVSSEAGSAPPTGPAAEREPASGAVDGYDTWLRAAPEPQRVPRRARTGKAASLVLVVTLGVAAFLYYERVADDAAEPALADLDRPPATLAIAEPEPAVESPRAPAAASTDDPSSGASRAPPVAPPTGIEAEVATPAAGEPPVAALEPAAAAATDSASPAAARVEGAPPQARVDAPRAEPAAARDEPATAAADEPAAAPTFELPAAVVRVVESEAAAPIVIERRGDVTAAASVVWWTSDETAVAGNDYADLGQRTELFARGEARRTIHVPLIRDELAEPTESFFVYLGRFDAERRHLETLASTRVDVADDD